VLQYPHQDVHVFALVVGEEEVEVVNDVGLPPEGFELDAVVVWGFGVLLDVVGVSGEADDKLAVSLLLVLEGYRVLDQLLELGQLALLLHHVFEEEVKLLP